MNPCLRFLVSQLAIALGIPRHHLETAVRNGPRVSVQDWKYILRTHKPEKRMLHGSAATWDGRVKGVKKCFLFENDELCWLLLVLLPAAFA